jgi:hypothetical protein
MIKNSQGFIALTSVLILSAVFLSIAISVNLNAVSVFDTSVSFRDRDTARYIAHACEEYALMELERTLDYQGNENLVIDNKTCEIHDIEGEGEANRVLKVQSTIGSHTYYIEDIIEEVSPEMIITSSKRTDQF